MSSLICSYFIQLSEAVYDFTKTSTQILCIFIQNLTATRNNNNNNNFFIITMMKKAEKK